MKILIVCSGNYLNFDFEKNQAFIYDQITDIQNVNPEITFHKFFIIGKGLFGYLRNFSRLRKEINTVKPDLIHAHGGLVGILSSLQRKIPTICTFHGSDINEPRLIFFSTMTSIFSKSLIFVSDKLKNKSILKFNHKSTVIPCAVNLNLFYPIEKLKLKAPHPIQKILFASAFDIKVKNFSLAQKAIENIQNIEILELKNKSRQQVSEMINSVDLLLLTSFSEGSPQIIKEALACNCPIVSTDVGDVSWLIGNTDGCFICNYDPKDVANKIQLALEFSKSVGHNNGRQRIIELGLDSESIANRIIAVYQRVYSASYTND